METKINNLREAQDSILSWLECSNEASLQDLNDRIFDFKFVRDEYLMKRELEENEVTSLFFLTKLIDSMEEVMRFKLKIHTN